MSGRAVPIGHRAFDIIETLVRAAGQLVTKSELMDRVWPGIFVEDATLRVHISAIRKALGPDRTLLSTASGRGYRLLGDWIVSRHDRDAGAVTRAPTQAPPETIRSNLPIATSDVIGRAVVLRRVCDLVSAYRLVTLTGAGGIGKTRVALEAARMLLADFHGDVWWIELGSLSDASLIAVTIAGELGLDLARSDVSPQAVGRSIGGRKLLLVIDNCEHLIDAAATTIDTLICLCPSVSVLVTSREILRIQGEHTFRVPPLDFPTQASPTPDQDLLRDSSAVQLFLARLAWPQPSEPQHDRNTLSAIAEICRHLDGIPLAIEFAAAHAETLGVNLVLSYLGDRFALLTSGRRTSLPKHRTLRATLDWSYELLTAAERRLLQQVAIFAGTFSLQAASAVAGGDAIAAEVARGVGDLVAKSLVVRETDAAEYRLLETTRAYALEKLAESGDLHAVARRHAEYFPGLLGSVESERSNQASI